MSLVRLLKTAQVTLTHEFRVDETLTDAAGGVTVTVKRLDGTSIVGSPFTASHPSLGTYTFALPGQADLDSLTLDWSGTVAGAAVVVRDYAEIVGGFLFGLAEARARHALSATTYPAAAIAAARIEVEQEAEKICGQAFVPRFARIAVSGNDTPRIRVPWPLLRTLRAVTIDGTAWSAPDVGAVALSDHGVLTRPAGALWPAGSSNIVLEYEHGWDYPPEPIRTAAMLRLRSLLGQPSSGVPDRASSFTVADGGVYRLSLPTGEKTGITAVDGAYAKYPRQKRAVFA